ncbi:ankyrin [Cubamyces sp. BRFM 1775]|nr:ankyrin [Cubamyces sp. BRFM 1775]
MHQTPEAQAFLGRIAQLPRGPGITDALLQALQPSLADEAELRKLFATDKSNARLTDPYVGLVDVFDAPDDIRTTRARAIAGENNLSAEYIFPLSEKQRRKDGDPAMVSKLDDFKKNWAIFSEGSLSQLTDWSNVVVAGGSISACLAPLPDSAKTSKRTMRKYFHSNAFPTSDVDVFLYGLTPEQAEAKMQVIYEAVRDSVPWDVTCVRTKHTVSIHSQYPYRSVQIVLRLYSSPAEILAGFDVDSPCCLFDGQRVWANPRAIVAMMRQCNTVDMSRRSPSYEVRLAKYSARGFEVHVLELRREDIDPTTFERSITRVQGLARLLVLERFANPDTRMRYLTDRRNLRARPQLDIGLGQRRRRMKGDLKADADIGGLEMNDYDVQSLHVPYGPGWDARRIDKLVYQTDLGMNSPFNPKNKDRRLHRHPAFFGTMQECLEDCCEFCPEPKDAEEKELQQKEDEAYVRGRVEFIREDPGRQSISGSFNPIDEGEWSEQAYMGQTEKLFNAIVAGDRATVARVLSQEGTGIDRRDHVGRTPLQFAILSKEVDIACDLIDSGARMTARLVDGRTALHLVAQLDLSVVLRKLLERSAVNAEKAEEEAAAKKAKENDSMDVDEDEGKDDEGEDSGDDDSDEEQDSSEDDWSSEDGDRRKKSRDDASQKPDTAQIPEDDEDVPDVFDVNLPDWDYAFTPLHYAVAFASLSTLDQLLAAGANPKLAITPDNRRVKYFHPLTLTLFIRDIDAACEVAKKLFSYGAVSSEADDNLFTIFHRIVCARKPILVDTFLRHDPNAQAVLDAPHVERNTETIFPVVSAIGKGSHTTLAVLLAYGAKYVYSEEDWSHACELRKDKWNQWNASWQSMIMHPVEVALAQLDDVASLLVNIGAEYNIGNRDSNRESSGSKMTILDYVRGVIPALREDAATLLSHADDEYDVASYRKIAALPGWKGGRGQHLLELAEKKPGYKSSRDEYAERSQKLLQAAEYFEVAEGLLTSKGAKTWKELYPDSEINQPSRSYYHSTIYIFGYRRLPQSYVKLTGTYGSEEVPAHLVSLYDELFEACCSGNKDKIEELCLPKDGKSRSGSKLLQITCRFGSDYGLTPLTMALYNRHWEAARLVLAIAVAQYKAAEDKPTKFIVSKNLALEDDDSEGGSECDSDEEMDEEERKPISFIDIAQRPSQVQTDTHPSKLLDLADAFQCPKTGKEVSGPPLFKAIMDDDFEAFVQIADLYKALPTPHDLPGKVFDWIMQYDRPNMLDEVIRRTGTGIDLPQLHEEEDDGSGSTSKTLPPKTYLGLNVHGKKRKDLAQKGDPNAPLSSGHIDPPLLWKAAHDGAIGIIEYLATERPVAAYDYYVSTHSDERAQALRRNRIRIPQRLGWAPNELNETVITGAVMGDRIEVIEILVKMRPAEMQSALMTRIHYAGMNNILVAVNIGCSQAMFDYLLTKGVSPTDTDIRGWNVYHHLATSKTDKHIALLEHVLSKLPEDVTARLLCQQSKGALNTPLHLAVKRNNLRALDMLLRKEAPVFSMRDQDGSTPLHVAIRNGYSKIARFIADAGPDNALYTEDGVGNTPLELSIQRWLQSKTAWHRWGGAPSVETLSSNLSPYTSRRFASQDEVILLKDMLNRLVDNGRLRKGTKLATELVAFADRMEVEAQKRTAVEAVEARPVKVNDDDDDDDAEETFACISATISARPGRRVLVHLIDVHRSVKNGLERVTQEGAQDKVKDDDMEAEVAEDEIEKAKERCAFNYWKSPACALSSVFDADGY